MPPAEMDHPLGTVSKVWHNLDITAFQLSDNVTTYKPAFSCDEHFHN
jgi:hypothetical protein